jgi:uncharacterized protein (TIGR04222 family)
MSPNSESLWLRIEAFDVDGEERDLPFASRLAREQGWTREYADRVVLEYKRFMFLAACSNTPRCPSEDVDAAWHLHLTYTKSYWQRFCGETVGSTLHHEPTKGGPQESTKHRVMYEETLAAYHKAFGKRPPSDVWPPTAKRFDAVTGRISVDPARVWILPKPPLSRLTASAAMLAMIAIFVPGCLGTLNPFRLEGPAFLLLLIPAMIAAVVYGRRVHFAFEPAPTPEDDELELTAEQAAYLGGGHVRLATSAISRLVESGFIQLNGDFLERGEATPEGLSPVETAIISRLPIHKSQLRSLPEALTPAFASEVERLVEDGMTNPPNHRSIGDLASLLPLVAVMLTLGLPRLIMGMSAHKPVEYLVLTLFAGGFVGAVICLGGSRIANRRGRHVLDRMQARAASGETHAGMSVALFGTAALAGTSIAFLKDWYPRTTESSGDGGGCGSGCGAGCGGGSGCGGCGGGGD